MDHRPHDDSLAELSNLVVLIVDDDDDCRELLATLLETRNARVVCASGAEEGLAQVREARPDVVVSDIGMPGEDGYSFMRRMRALPPAQGGGIPAIALTAFGRLRDRHEALKAGFTQHLPKPVDLAQLCAEIQLLGRATDVH